MSINRLALVLVLLAGCNVETHEEVSASSAELRASEALALSRGKRETLVTGIVAAENQIFSAAGRLYVSGDNGVFELSRATPAAPITATQLVSIEGCNFGGMSERAATLYAVCYDGTSSYLYAAAETALPSFERIFDLPDVPLANGMATDGASLYVTVTVQSTILRLVLDPSDPMRVAAREAFPPLSSGLLPNGIKISGGDVYFGDVGTIRRASLENPARSTAPINALTYFDDLWVSDRVVLVTDYVFGSVLAFSTGGPFLGGTPFGTFRGPSSVGEAKGRLGLGARTLIVTEKNASSVAVFRY